MKKFKIFKKLRIAKTRLVYNIKQLFNPWHFSEKTEKRIQNYVNPLLKEAFQELMDRVTMYRKDKEGWDTTTTPYSVQWSSLKDRSEADCTVFRLNHCEECHRRFRHSKVEVTEQMSFKLKEAPDWLFGIWFSVKMDKKNKMPTAIDGQLFAQYLKEIDKFKPSRSPCNVEFSIPIDLLEIKRKTGKYIDEDGFNYDWSDIPAAEMVHFIISEPAMAFCYDQLYWNGRYGRFEIHSKEEAEEEMKAYLEREAAREKYKKAADQEYLDTIQKILDSGVLVWRGARIQLEEKAGSGLDAERDNLEDAEDVKYEIVAPLSKNTDLVDTRGFYSLFAIPKEEDEGGDEDEKAIKEEFSGIEFAASALNDLTERLRENASNQEPPVWWSPWGTIEHEWIRIYDDSNEK